MTRKRSLVTGDQTGSAKAPRPGGASQVVDAVEIKATVRPDQELRALRALKLDEDSAEVRLIYFYDTPKLLLFDAGVVLRARLVKGDADDTTVKIRPVIPAKISRKWSREAGFKIETDRTGTRLVRSASLTKERKRSQIDEVSEGGRPVRELFTETQLQFLSETSSVAVDFDLLKPLGPIRVLCWTSDHKGFPHKLTTEEWRLPDGEDLVEVSIKVKPDQAIRAHKQFDDHLRELGLDPHGAQETKTRTALDYFAREFRSHRKKK